MTAGLLFLQKYLICTDFLKIMILTGVGAVLYAAALLIFKDELTFSIISRLIPEKLKRFSGKLS